MSTRGVAAWLVWLVWLVFGGLINYKSSAGADAFVADQVRLHPRRQQVAIRPWQPRHHLWSSHCLMDGRVRRRRNGTVPRYSLPKGSLLSAMTLLSSTWTAPSFRAGSTLLLSALLGHWSERKLVPNSGILVTLGLSAAASNVLHFAPSNHPLYDTCWSTIVPMSLALLLLSLSSTTASASSTATGKDSSTDMSIDLSSSILKVVLRLALPFCFAAIGSILGCMLSFLMCRQWPQAIGLSPSDALQAAACLTASFIGGSVNFFATASIVSIDGSSTSNHHLARASGPASRNTATLTSAMAAADVVIMALYFAALSCALKSQRMQQWFHSSHEPKRPDARQAVALSTSASENAAVRTDSVSNMSERTNILVGQCLACALAFVIVQVAKVGERLLAPWIPGTTCAFVVALTLLVSRWLVRPFANLAVGKDMPDGAASLSSVAFLVFFAAIGVSADVKAALRHGPACFLFSLLSLTVHAVVTVTGSLVVNKLWLATRPQSTLTLGEVLVASNAAIGGPATAAAFSGQVVVPPRPPPSSLRSASASSSQYQQGLAVAATVWGVVGYAIGTTIGVALYRALRPFVF